MKFDPTINLTFITAILSILFAFVAIRNNKRSNQVKNTIDVISKLFTDSNLINGREILLAIKECGASDSVDERCREIGAKTKCCAVDYVNFIEVICDGVTGGIFDKSIVYNAIGDAIIEASMQIKLVVPEEEIKKGRFRGIKKAAYEIKIKGVSGCSGCSPGNLGGFSNHMHGRL